MTKQLLWEMHRHALLNALRMESAAISETALGGGSGEENISSQCGFMLPILLGSQAGKQRSQPRDCCRDGGAQVMVLMWNQGAPRAGSHALSRLLQPLIWDPHLTERNMKDTPLWPQKLQPPGGLTGLPAG